MTSPLSIWRGGQLPWTPAFLGLSQELLPGLEATEWGSLRNPKNDGVSRGGSLQGTGLPGSPCGLTSVSVCGAYYKDGCPDAGGLSKGQAAVLLLREDRGLVVDVLHVHYYLWEPGQGHKVSGTVWLATVSSHLAQYLACTVFKSTCSRTDLTLLVALLLTPWEPMTHQ